MYPDRLVRNIGLSIFSLTASAVFSARAQAQACADARATTTVMSQWQALVDAQAAHIVKLQKAAHAWAVEAYRAKEVNIVLRAELATARARLAAR
jgi:acetolactate synthase regulatory subunit